MMKRAITPLLLGLSFSLAQMALAEDNLNQTLTATNVADLIKVETAKSRIKNQVVQQYLTNCVQCSFVDDNNALSTVGAALYQALKTSDQQGLNPQQYHVEKIDAILVNKENDSLKKVDALLIDGALSYIRDLVEGRPELKRLDSDWLLDGRKVDPAKALIDLIAKNGATDFSSLEPNYPQYQNLKKSLAAYQKKIDQGIKEKQLSDGKVLRKGDAGARVIELRERLVELGFLATDKAEGSHFDSTLEKAVKEFQANHLLEPDGVVGRQSINELNMRLQDRLGQIKINLERWRWMPESLGDHFLVVDIPRFEYVIYKDGAEVMRAKTVVGMNRRQTPVFSSEMSYIVFSPYWNVPYSMAVKDQLPKLRQDPYRLERSNIRIYDRAGNEVDPGMIDWDQYTAKTFPFTLRQDPGAYNSMGRVKFMFPNKHAIYLHDTPQRYLFDKTARTFSSGCIRIENPTELAEYLLEDQGWSRNKITQSFDRKSEASVRLSKDMKFPVYTLYMTAEADLDGKVSFRPDIYNKDEKILKAL